ncbi:unnamed protein product [Meloidogyne enterolobii]|uniref:Uncharacterized protein n=1 Tax=Meloidogyne enterolobii TaxID=390850 RepID=A0ACB0Y3G5_MELEN
MFNKIFNSSSSSLPLSTTKSTSKTTSSSLKSSKFSSSLKRHYSFSSKLRSLILPLIVLLACILFSASETVANDDTPQIIGNAQFFRRNAKWSNLPSGGGSLVSGRGNFRPGFHSSLDTQEILSAEPLFLLKRSYQLPERKTPFAMFDRPYFTDFARRR